MQILDPWESHFHEWKREREEQEIEKKKVEENLKKLIEFEKLEVEEAKKKDVYNLLGLMYRRKRMILLLLAILSLVYLFLVFFY